MPRTPLVTVALPVYNGARYLEATIEALLAQTMRDFELLILDNASTDATPRIAAAAARRDRRVRVVHRATNVGGNANFNDGFARCRSPYFVWASADDLHEPTFLEETLAALEARPDAACAFPANRVVDEHGQPLPYDAQQKAYLVDGRPWYHDMDAELAVTGDDPAERFAALLHSRISGTLVYGLFRAEALRAVPLFADARSDVHVLSELALRAPFVRVPNTLFSRRLHPGATWKRSRREIVRYETARNGLLVPPWRAALQYGRGILKAPVSAQSKARSLAALTRYASRRDILRNFVVPGPANYWGFGQPTGA